MVKYHKHYNSRAARKAYFEAKAIEEKVGNGEHAKWLCENPDCKKIEYLSDLDIHHLIPRRVAPSLTYNPSNMILLCKECHQEIENNQERRHKSPYSYKKLFFCQYCGGEVELKKDRIGDNCYHHKCLLKFLRSEQLEEFIKSEEQKLEAE